MLTKEQIEADLEELILKYKKVSDEGNTYIRIETSGQIFALARVLCLKGKKWENLLVRLGANL